jgi:hypothetical protein
MEVDMASTLKERWNRLMGAKSATTVEQEVEKEQMAPAERHDVEQSIDDKKADAAAGEHVGGIDPERLLGDEEPPKD